MGQNGRYWIGLGICVDVIDLLSMMCDGGRKRAWSCIHSDHCFKPKFQGFHYVRNIGFSGSTDDKSSKRSSPTSEQSSIVAIEVRRNEKCSRPSSRLLAMWLQANFSLQIFRAFALSEREVTDGRKTLTAFFTLAKPQAGNHSTKTDTTTDEIYIQYLPGSMQCQKRKGRRQEGDKGQRQEDKLNIVGQA